VESLDLIDIGDQITHNYLSLDDEYTEEDLGNDLNIFQFDPNYEESERKYDAIRKEILGDSQESSEEEEEDAEEDTCMFFPSFPSRRSTHF
jgi:pre-mRNA-splicing factor CWC22